ncbi:MAG: DUF2442 domain-containing protein [Acidobacteria bacterium]|nr:DUF2442 domain-containing protein [Acidobacteriota bacterium]
MLQEIVETRPVGGYRIFVRFADGAHGIVDVSALIRFKGVFAPLVDLEHFNRVSVHAELGTVCWPGGVDLDPDVLYAHVSGEPVCVPSSPLQGSSPTISPTTPQTSEA